MDGFLIISLSNALFTLLRSPANDYITASHVGPCSHIHLSSIWRLQHPGDLLKFTREKCSSISTLFCTLRLLDVGKICHEPR